MFLDASDIFDNIDVIHFVFKVGSTPKNAFHPEHVGTIHQDVTLSGPGGIYYQNKPITLQWESKAVVHERMHVLGDISGSPNGFRGFPDRGSDAGIDEGGGFFHYNLYWGCDMMFHNGVIPARHSLYALPPMITHDLIFLEWIQPDEILEINGSDSYQIKLADVNYPLTPEQIADGFYRVVKVMIHENFQGDLDEYLLIEFHNATEFDKNATNYDEFDIIGGHNKGVQIHHVRENTNMVNLFSDNKLDIELAVPYNGWNGVQIPDDAYPRDYTRNPNWNNIAGDFDYLDDLQVEFNPGHPGDGFNEFVFSYLQDGGRSYWELTDPRDIYPWYKPEPEWFYRPMSLRSDFFTDEEIKGQVINNFTHLTRPSTKDWHGNSTFLAVTDVRRVDNYMVLDIYQNYLDGELNEDLTMDGTFTIGEELIIPTGITLTINAGSNLQFVDGGILTVEGNLIVNGSSQSRVTFTSINSNPIKGVWGGVNITGSSASATIQFCDIEYATNGLQISDGANAIVNDSKVIQSTNGVNFLTGGTGSLTNTTTSDNNTGIRINDSEPTITNFNIVDNGYGIYISNSYSPSWTQEHIKSNHVEYNTTYGIYLLNSSPTLSENVIRNNHNNTALFNTVIL